MSDRLHRRAACLLLGLLALTGCRASEGFAGRSGVAASYRLGTLTADLPDEVRVRSVLAAADATLRARGYSVVGEQATADRGWARGSPPAGSLLELEDVTIWSRLSRTGTRLGVDVKPIGAEAQARAIMDDLLRRLGR